MADKTKIDWCDATWNPVMGCSRGCWFCYAKELCRRFGGRKGWPKNFTEPEFFPERLSLPSKWKKSRRIFVCSMGELFDSKVPTKWTEQIFKEISNNERHRFLILTKMPSNARFWIKDLPAGSMMGESIVKYNHDDKSARTTFRLNAWPIRGCDHFISFEPLLGPAAEAIDEGTRWVIIGALTGPHARQPEREWVQEILDRADDAGIPVLMKHNLEWDGERRFEFPPELEKIRNG